MQAPPANNSRFRSIGTIVIGSLLLGLALALFLVLVPFAGAEENVISGVILLSFSIGWALIAILSIRFTDQPQRWAFVPAGLMALAAVVLLVWPDSVTHETFSWIWPPIVLALVVWMVMQIHRNVHGRVAKGLLYALSGVLTLAAVGGAYETVQERIDHNNYEMPGQLVAVGDHRLHLNCTGTGSPTVILEAGLGDFSAMMDAWIAPAIADDTRVCTYDRAGRGWSESASGPQDAVAVATDLHTLLSNARIEGPYVLAGHSAGGLYTQVFAHLYQDDVAGLVLLDSMSPDQYEKVTNWSRFYQMWRRASALAPSLARLGVMRVIAQTSFGALPADERDEERAFHSTARYWRSQRDEFSKIRASLEQAGELKSIGAKPLIVLTAQKDAEGNWIPVQDEMAKLSTNADHRVLADATHTSLTEEREYAAMSAQAIRDVVDAVRTGSPLTR